MAIYKCIIIHIYTILQKQIHTYNTCHSQTFLHHRRITNVEMSLECVHGIRVQYSMSIK